MILRGADLNLEFRASLLLWLVLAMSGGDYTRFIHTFLSNNSSNIQLFYSQFCSQYSSVSLIRLICISYRRIFISIFFQVCFTILQLLNLASREIIIQARNIYIFGKIL